MAGTVTLASLHWGTGTRRCLLIHGISSSAAGWWRVGPALAASGWSVTAVDLRGHGRSPRTESYGFDEYCADIGAGGWDAVVGHSFGGAIALRCAARSGGFADRLVLEDPALSSGDPHLATEWLLDPFTRPLTAAQVSADHPRWHEEDAAVKAEALGQTSPEIIAATAAAGWDVHAELRAISVPTLLLGADPVLGALLPPDLGEAVAGRNPLVTFRVVEGGSHSIHRDAFDEFMGHVGGFLAVDPDSGG